MSVGPPNVSFVPSERLIIFAPFCAAQRIAWDVLKDDPWPFNPRARRAITLTWAVPATSWPLSMMAAMTPATPVPWETPDGSSIGFVSPVMKADAWFVARAGVAHLVACRFWWRRLG